MRTLRSALEYFSRTHSRSRVVHDSADGRAVGEALHAGRHFGERQPGAEPQFRDRGAVGGDGFRTGFYHPAAFGSERAMVEQAWHLGDLAAAYEDFLGDFAGIRPESSEQVLLARIRLVDQWRHFPGSTRSCRWSCFRPIGSVCARPTSSGNCMRRGTGRHRSTGRAWSPTTDGAVPG